MEGEISLNSFNYKGQTIEYTLSRKAKKNVNFRINSKGEVCISAPRYVSKTELEKMILGKAEWIVKTKNQIIHQKKSPINNKIQSGNKIYLNGVPYEIKITPSSSNHIDVQNDLIEIKIKNSKLDSPKYIESFFNTWLNECTYKIAQKYMDIYLDKLKKYNLKKPELTIRTMTSRWGSCTPSINKITINKNLMYPPFECFEYVVLHELAHLVEANHSKKFYAVIESVMPDWKKRKKILNEF